MIVFPNGKINLGLQVTEKRTDGYHNLETVFYPVGCRDVLEIIRAPEFLFSTTGLEITGSKDNNLCNKAYQLLQKKFDHLPQVHIHLHKLIPMGAGLGGGSADGAFTLLLLNDKLNLGLAQKELLEFALQLGSDCPFFIRNQPCFAAGRGERMEPVALDLSAFELVLVHPGIHVSTANAFAGLTPQAHAKSIKNIIAQPIATWRLELINDFEKTVFNQYPEIADIKEELYRQGALYASMSGTGSTVFGLFEKGAYQFTDFPDHYWVYRS